MPEPAGWPKVSAPLLCQHCAARPVRRPRGLCWACFQAPGVRDRYAPLGDFGRRLVAAARRSGAATGHDPEPTAERPGTPGKVAVLEGRAARGERLWHPGDARL